MSMKSCFGGTWKHPRWRCGSKCCYTSLKNLATNSLSKCIITSTNIAITSHSRNGQLDIARKLFDEMPRRTVVSWNTMISAYSKWGRFEEALNLLSLMHFNNVKLNETTFCSGLSVCARLPSTCAGKQLHGLVLKCGSESFELVGSALLYCYANCYEIADATQVFDVMHERNRLLWSLMLVGYVKCNLLDDALDVFNRMPTPDVITWTAIIFGFSKRDDGFEKALELFCLMRKKGEAVPNEFTFDCLVRACGRLFALLEGMTVHGLVIKYGFEFEHSINGALIDFYCTCKAIEEAELVFNGLVKKDSTTYNLMIKAYSLVGRYEDALDLFVKMPTKSLSSLNTMISVYSRNANLNKALEIFEGIKQERDTVTWNSMISGYIHNNQHENALKLYLTMHRLGMDKSRSTFSTLFHACSCVGSLRQGQLLHAQLAKTPLASNAYIGTTLVDMYSKCGNITDAKSSFINIVNPNVAAWTAMINGYTHHGLCSEAILLLKNMVHQGVNPNGATFIGVLSACAHAGWVNEGMMYLRVMKESYGIKPTLEHFTYAVDLLGRSGHIHEAEKMIKEMPFEPDNIIFGALLKACWFWLELEVGERVAKKMVYMDRKPISAYVIMSNMYSSLGKWTEKIKVRKILSALEAKKDPGRSWIEINNKVCVFSVEDRSHSCCDIIFATLEHLTGIMQLDNVSCTYNSG